MILLTSIILPLFFVLGIIMLVLIGLTFIELSRERKNRISGALYLFFISLAFALLSMFMLYELIAKSSDQIIFTLGLGITSLIIILFFRLKSTIKDSISILMFLLIFSSLALRILKLYDFAYIFSVLSGFLFFIISIKHISSNNTKKQNFISIMNKKSIILFSIIILSSVLIFGLFTLFISITQNLSSELDIYTPKDYFDESLILNFEREENVKLNIHTFTDENEIIEKINTNSLNYDLIIADSEFLREMANYNILAFPRLNNIPNIKNVGKPFIQASSISGRIYSIPLAWDTNGIIINNELITGLDKNEESLDLLWDFSYSGKLAAIKNQRYIFEMALRYAGLPSIPQSHSHLISAKDLLMSQKSLLKEYKDYDSIKEDLISGNIAIAFIDGGKAKELYSQDDKFRYFIPKEGSLLKLESLGIPINSEKKYTSEVFINYLLDSKVNNLLLEKTGDNPCSANIKEIEETISQNYSFDLDGLNNFNFFQNYPVISNDLSVLKNEYWAEILGVEK